MNDNSEFDMYFIWCISNITVIFIALLCLFVFLEYIQHITVGILFILLIITYDIIVVFLNINSTEKYMFENVDKFVKTLVRNTILCKGIYTIFKNNYL